MVVIFCFYVKLFSLILRMCAVQVSNSLMQFEIIGGNICAKKRLDIQKLDKGKTVKFRAITKGNHS